MESGFRESGTRFQNTIYFLLREMQVVFPLFPIISWFLGENREGRSRPRFAWGGCAASEGELTLAQYFLTAERGRWSFLRGEEPLFVSSSVPCRRTNSTGYTRRGNTIVDFRRTVQADWFMSRGLFPGCTAGGLSGRFSGGFGRFPGRFFPGGIFRVGETGAGGAYGVPRSLVAGGDVRPARAEGKRDPAFADVQVQPGEDLDPFVKPQSHENTCFSVIDLR